MINISKLYCGKAASSDEIRYSQENSYGPVVVYNCTNRCNLNCRHCYSSSVKSGKIPELDTKQAKELIAQIAKINCPVILFSGGEPLLRHDLYELLAEAKKTGLRTVISTNGTLIDSDAAEKLAEAGVGYVGISVDGDEKFHDDFRSVNGSFRAALRGIENCKKAGLKTGLRFTMTMKNYQFVPFIFELAIDNGIRRICFYHLVRSGRAKKLADQAMTAPQIRQTINIIIEKTAEYVNKGLLDEVLTVDNHADGPYLLIKMADEKNSRYDEAKRLLLANGGNKTGEKIACVSWDGEVYPDQFWRNYSLGNVKNRTLKQIWNNTQEPVLHKLRDKSQFADKQCLRCMWFDLCKGNFRFLDGNPDEKNWLNEPACYLTGKEVYQK